MLRQNCCKPSAIVSKLLIALNARLGLNKWILTYLITYLSSGQGLGDNGREIGEQDLHRLSLSNRQVGLSLKWTFCAVR